MADKKISKKIQKLADQILHDSLKPIVRQVIKDVDLEIKSAIERFYNDEMDKFYNMSYVAGHTFQPYTYQRKHGLEDMYRVTTKWEKDGCTIRWRFASDLETAQHTRWNGNPDDANDIVYNYDFVQGYHGGKIYGKNFPRGWRYPRLRTFDPTPYEQIRDYIANYTISDKYFKREV